MQRRACSGVSREASVLQVVLKKIVLFPPTCKQPVGEDFLIMSRNVLDGKSPPVHIDRFGWATFEVGGTQREEILAVLATACTR